MKTNWTRKLPADVYSRLCECHNTKADLPILVDCKWSAMKESGKDKEGYTKADALADIMDLLDSNNQWFIIDCLTREEYEALKEEKTMKKSYTLEEIAAWIDVISAYEEHSTDSLYTVEDAASDLESHKECMGSDADIDLDAVTPEQYMEAMNYNILHVWQSYTPQKTAENPAPAADDDFVEDWIGWVKAAYVKVYGPEKWRGLTDQQRHDVVMILARDTEKALLRMEA